ncbi:MAG: hypothetical protein JNN30_12795, partial [Rhodanobacteraceae bacterium]|nr:hypothetical protein [Rhodanobacteraceae bacterium]
RIYDPRLGRFLQADPFVQAPRDSQSFNRYSYVFNNPLAYTDPSGYFGGKQQQRFRCLGYPGFSGLLPRNLRRWWGCAEWCCLKFFIKLQFYCRFNLRVTKCAF